VAKSKFSARKTTKPKRKRTGKKTGTKSNAWRAYVAGGRVSNAPLPD
jgi:hypothetical protein